MSWIRRLPVVIATLACMAAGQALAQSPAVDAAYARMRAAAAEFAAIPDERLAQMPADALESHLLRILTVAGEVATEVDRLGLTAREEKALEEARLGGNAREGMDQKMARAFEAIEKFSAEKRKAIEERLNQAMARLSTPTLLKRAEVSMGLLAASSLRLAIADFWSDKRRLPSEQDLAEDLKSARETLRKENHPAQLSYAGGAVTLRYNASIAEGGVLTLAPVAKGSGIEFVCRANAPLRRFVPATCEAS
jgi:hypothetical protein